MTARTHLALLVLILGSCVDRDGRPVVIPLQNDPGLELGVRLTFNNRTAWFGFDTGAGAHTLASWFVAMPDPVAWGSTLTRAPSSTCVWSPGASKSSAGRGRPLTLLASDRSSVELSTKESIRRSYLLCRLLGRTEIPCFLDPVYGDLGHTSDARPSSRVA